MQIKIAEIITRWLDGKYGVNRYLSSVNLEEGDPSPAPPKLITNYFTDKHLINKREVQPIFPQVIVDMTQPVRIAGDGSGNYRRGLSADVEIVVMAKSADPVEANFQIQAILEAIDMSLQELIFSRESTESVQARTYGGYRLDALTEVEYGAIGDAGQDGVQMGLFTATFSVSNIKPRP